MVTGEFIVFKLASNWLKKLVKNLAKIRKERSEEISSISDTFGDVLHLANLYIEPNCQQFNPADDHEDDSNIIRTPVFPYLEKVFLNGPKQSGGKNQLFILSDAGMGKSSLLSMLWLSYINSFWPKEFKCTLLKLGQHTLSDIKKIKDKNSHILLLDGLDEDPLSYKNIEQRIRNILIESQYFYRVITTCRTQFFSGGNDPFNRRGHVEVAGFLCPVIYLSLFDSEQVDSYLEKSFSKNSVVGRENITKAKHLLSKMNKLKFRPMLLAHAEDLIQAECIEWNEYTVYEALIQAWLNREHRKSVWNNNESPPSLSDLLEITREVAFVLQSNDIPSLDAIHLHKLIERNPKAKKLQFIDIGGRSLLNKNSKGEFRFSHFSVQEFLLAQGVIEGLFVTKKSIKATNQMIQFICAWLSENKHAINCFPWSVLNLTSISYRNMTLSGYNFSQVDLRFSDFSNADLSYANLQGADLRNATLQTANLANANLTNVLYSDDTKWPNDIEIKDTGIFIGKNTDLQGVDLTEIDLSNTNLQGANLSNAKLSSANLQNASLVSAKLIGTDFQEAIIHETDFSNAEIQDTDFSYSSGVEPKFSDAKITNTNFLGAELIKVDFERTTISYSDFNDANLENAYFEGARLTSVSFDHTNLEGVTGLESASMTKVDFKGARLDH